MLGLCATGHGVSMCRMPFGGSQINVFHGKEALLHGYLKLIPPAKAVVMGENGQPHFCEQGMCLIAISVD